MKPKHWTRPAKPPKKVVNVRLDPEQIRKIDDCCKDQDITFAEFARSAFDEKLLKNEKAR